MVQTPSQRDDRRFLHRAIDRHGDLVYRLAFRVLGNRADAEDAAQECFLKLLRARQSRRRIADERAWLAVTALNTARNVVRSEHNRRRREEVWAETARLRRREAEGSRMDEIWRHVEALPDALRIPLILHYQEGIKFREIAAALGCAEGTVAFRISSARERIRTRMNGVGADHGRNRTSPTSRT